jgi:hypothetical protein
VRGVRGATEVFSGGMVVVVDADSPGIELEGSEAGAVPVQALTIRTIQRKINLGNFIIIINSWRYKLKTRKLVYS